MFRRIITCYSVLAFALLLPSTMDAQRLQQSVQRPLAPNAVAPEQRPSTPSAWKYVWIGAAVGAGVAAIGLKLDGSASEATLAGIIIPATILSSAIVGGLIGWVVHLVRY